MQYSRNFNLDQNSSQSKASNDRTCHREHEVHFKSHVLFQRIKTLTKDPFSAYFLIQNGQTIHSRGSASFQEY